MEDYTHEPYRDSPAASVSSTPKPENSVANGKPLPSLPDEAPAYTEEPYRDDPLRTEDSILSSVSRGDEPSSSPRGRGVGVFVEPYTDISPDHDDDVPLAHLLPVPTGAPPSYAVAVTQSYRDTLIQHIPHSSVSTEADEEVGIERWRPDDVRFGVERVVAAFVVSLLLFTLAVLLIVFAMGLFSWNS